MGALDWRAVLQKWTSPLAVLGIVVLATLFVKNREQLAVARANLQRQADSVAVAWQHDSVYHQQQQQVIDSLARVARGATARAIVTERGADSALANMATGIHTAADSLQAYAFVINRQQETILGLHQALAASALEIDSLSTANLDLAKQLESSQRALRAALKGEARQPFLSGTSWRVLEVALMVKGGVDVFRGR